MTKKFSALTSLNLGIQFGLLTGILVVIAIYTYFAFSNPHAGLHFSDAVRYLFMADWIRGATDEITNIIVGRSIYPLLFPIYLSLTGAGTESIVAAHLATTLSLVLACLAFYWWLKAENFSVILRLLTILLFLVLPGIFLHSMKVVSEYLFLGLLLGAFASFRKGESNQRWIIVAAVFVGLSIVTRTVGIAMLPGLILAVRRLDLRKAILCISLAIGPYLAWQLLKTGGNQGVSYSDVLLDFLSSNSLLSIIGFIGTQLERLYFSWVLVFDRWTSPHVFVIQGILLLMAGFGFLKRLKELRQEALFVLFYGGIIVVWPYPLEAERFLLILLPVFFFYCFASINWLIEKRSTYQLGRALKILVPMVLVISIMPTLGFYFERYSEPVPEEILHMKYSPGWYADLNTKEAIYWATTVSRNYQLLGEVGQHVPEGECVYAILFDFVVLYTKRESIHLPTDMYAQIEEGGEYDVSQLNKCDYVIFMDLMVNQVPAYVRMYPFLAIKNQIEPILMSSIIKDDSEYVVSALAKIVR